MTLSQTKLVSINYITVVKIVLQKNLTHSLEERCFWSFQKEEKNNLLMLTGLEAGGGYVKDFFFFFYSYFYFLQVVNKFNRLPKNDTILLLLPNNMADKFWYLQRGCWNVSGPNRSKSDKTSESFLIHSRWGWEPFCTKLWLTIRMCIFSIYRDISGYERSRLSTIIFLSCL